MQRLIAMVAVLMGLTLAGTNVTADKAPPREDPKPEPKEEKSELPWGVEEIRKMWGDGIAFDFELKVDGVIDGGMCLESENITDTGFLATTVSIGKDGDERVEKSKEKTWDEYLGELKKRIKGAAITDEEITVPNDTYACKRYAIPAGASSVTYWLSEAVPGMFVKAETRTTSEGKETCQCWELADIDVPMVRLPWTRKQIIESWKEGVKISYAIAAGVDLGTSEMKVTAVDIRGYTAMGSEELNGEKTTSENRTNTWTRYLREINLSRKDSKISEETIETPAGKFLCMVITLVLEHTTKDEKKSKVTQKRYLAKEEPGLLVKLAMVEEVDGKLLTESFTLKEFKKGK